MINIWHGLFNKRAWWLISLFLPAKWRGWSGSLSASSGLVPALQWWGSWAAVMCDLWVLCQTPLQKNSSLSPTCADQRENHEQSLKTGPVEIILFLNVLFFSAPLRYIKKGIPIAVLLRQTCNFAAMVEYSLSKKYHMQTDLGLRNPPQLTVVLQPGFVSHEDYSNCSRLLSAWSCTNFELQI